MIDSIDRAKLDAALIAFAELMIEDDLREAYLLFFADKQDSSEAISVHEIHELFRFDELPERVWKLQTCSSSSGDGLYEGLEWLSVSFMTSLRPP